MRTYEVKGFALLAGFTWVEETFDADKRREIEREMPADLRQQLNQIRPEVWYPMAWFDALLKRIDREAGDDPVEKFQLVERCTAFIADENLNTVMKLLMKFLNTEKLVKNLPKMWSKYFRGTEAPTVEIVHGERRAVFLLDNFDGLRWTAPAVSGWIRKAFNMLGADRAEVEEVLNDPAAEHPRSFRWEIRW